MGWNKNIYISKHLPYTTRGGQDIDVYSKPEKYFFNIQYASGREDVVEYGARISNIQKAIVNIRYIYKIKEGDIAYLDGVKPNETNTNYNYKVISVRPQNERIAIYFEKIVKK